MSQDFSKALLLMLIGMGTVFLVLFLVVGIGNVLVRFVNRFLPEDEKKVVIKAVTLSGGIDQRIVAAISGAVSIVTQGKGKVGKIEKV